MSHVEENDSSNGTTGSMDQDLEWQWVRPTLHGSRGVVNQYTQLVIIDEIRSKLSLHGHEVFRRFLTSSLGSSFGSVNPEGFSVNTCFHQLLGQQVTIQGVDGDGSERWFRIGSRLLRFSRYEFVLITGLHFGDTNFTCTLSSFSDLPDHSVYKRLFWEIYGSKGITATQLREHFNSNNDYIIEDLLRIAQILVWAFILRGNNVVRSKIPVWIWVLVEDSFMWESYPWGNYTYDLLINGIDTVKAKPTDRYHFYGCSPALLVWCYEAIPEVARFFARKLKGVEGRERPRIARWDFKDLNRRSLHAASLGIGPLFEGSENQLQCRKYLSPTAAERSELYWTALQQWIGGTQELDPYGAEWPAPNTSVESHGGWNQVAWGDPTDYPYERQQQAAPSYHSPLASSHHSPLAAASSHHSPLAAAYSHHSPLAAAYSHHSPLDAAYSHQSYHPAHDQAPFTSADHDYPTKKWIGDKFEAERLRIESWVGNTIQRERDWYKEQNEAMLNVLKSHIDTRVQGLEQTYTNTLGKFYDYLHTNEVERDMFNARSNVYNQNWMYENLPRAMISNIETYLGKTNSAMPPPPPFHIPEDSELPYSDEFIGADMRAQAHTTPLRKVREKRPSRYQCSPYTTVDPERYKRFEQFIASPNTLQINSIVSVNGAWFEEIRSLSTELTNETPFFSGVERTPSEIRSVNDAVLPLQVNELMWELALPVGVDRDHKYSNPIRAPEYELLDKVKNEGWRLLVTVYQGDPLVDRVVEFVKMLKDKGVDVVEKIGEGGFHGSDSMDDSEANIFYGALKNFIFAL